MVSADMEQLETILLRVSRSSLEQRQRFYEHLCHSLTHSARSVLSATELEPGEVINRLMWLNEIQHDATTGVGVLRRNLHEWTEESFLQSVHRAVSQCTGIVDGVALAFQAAALNTFE